MKKSNSTRIVVSRQFEFLKNSRASLPFAKNNLFKDEIWLNRLMNGRIAINGRDEASFDQNGAIKLHPFDLWWRVRMYPRLIVWRGALLRSLVGSSSNDHNWSEVHRMRWMSTVIIPEMNGRDDPLNSKLNHVRDLKIMLTSRSLHRRAPFIEMWIRRSMSWHSSCNQTKQREHSPTQRKTRRTIRYIRWRDLEG